MGYLKNRDALGGIMDVATAAVRVVEDPCLFEVTQMVLKLHELEQTPTRPGTGTGGGGPPPPPVRGIGLCTAVAPLKAVVYVKSRPWIMPLAVGGIVGGLIGIGYLLGKPARGGSTP